MKSLILKIINLTLNTYAYICIDFDAQKQTHTHRKQSSKIVT